MISIAIFERSTSFPACTQPHTLRVSTQSQTRCAHSRRIWRPTVNGHDAWKFWSSNPTRQATSTMRTTSGRVIQLNVQRTTPPIVRIARLRISDSVVSSEKRRHGSLRNTHMPWRIYKLRHEAWSGAIYLPIDLSIYTTNVKMMSTNSTLSLSLVPPWPPSIFPTSISSSPLHSPSNSCVHLHRAKKPKLL